MKVRFDLNTILKITGRVAVSSALLLFLTAAIISHITEDSSIINHLVNSAFYALTAGFVFIAIAHTRQSAKKEQ
jgi:uncharacterized membrane protein